MASAITLTREEYTALVAFAREGVKDEDGRIVPEDSRRLEAFLEHIEERNGTFRSGLWIQWQEADQALPPSTEFPEKWPPELRFYLERVDRPIARSDVDALLTRRARRPVGVLVTKDPGGLVGWTELERFFVT